MAKKASLLIKKLLCESNVKNWLTKVIRYLKLPSSSAVREIGFINGLAGAKQVMFPQGLARRARTSEVRPYSPSYLPR